MGTSAWIVYFIVLGAVLAWTFLRRSGQVPIKQASEYVKQGAIIVDVRTPQEFGTGHLSQAFNMPLDNIEGTLPNKVKDRERVILVHCQSGIRSRKAKERLSKIGYKNVYDLGSYERAFKIVTGKSL